MKTAKKRRTRANRNTPEAAVEENPEVFEEVGGTEEEHRQKAQGNVQQEPGPNPGSIPMDGS